MFPGLLECRCRDAGTAPGDVAKHFGVVSPQPDEYIPTVHGRHQDGGAQLGQRGECLIDGVAPQGRAIGTDSDGRAGGGGESVREALAEVPVDLFVLLDVRQVEAFQRIVRGAVPSDLHARVRCATAQQV